MSKIIRPEDLTPEEYAKKTEWLSASKMMYIRTPKEYIYKLLNPDEETEAMRLGKALHCYMLEPEKFTKEFSYILASSFPVQRFNKDGSISKVPTENKAHLAQFEEENLGKTIITEPDLELIKNMVSSLELLKVNDYTLMDIISRSLLEQKHSAFFEIIKGEYEGEEDLKLISEEDSKKLDPVKLIKVHLKIDIECPDFKILFDLKSTKSVVKEEFARSAYQGDLPIQSKLYLDIISFIRGEEYDQFLYPAVEKVPPFLADMFYCDHEYLAYGERMYKKRLIALKRAIDAKEFKGHDINHLPNTTFTELGLPAYAYYNEKINF
jgi:hypothetical protein